MRYTLTLGHKSEDILTYCAVELGVTKAEAMRRAIQLFRHAALAKKIILTFPGGATRHVIVADSQAVDLEVNPAS